MAKRQQSKKKSGRASKEPLDVDGIIARADQERREADPYYRPSSRWSWSGGIYAPIAVADGPAPATVHRPSGGQFNHFTSARARKAAKAALRTSNNKKASNKKKS